jgi:hypothetical protein
MPIALDATRPVLMRGTNGVEERIERAQSNLPPRARMLFIFCCAECFFHFTQNLRCLAECRRY